MPDSNSAVKRAFEQKVFVLATDSIVPQKSVTPATRRSPTYKEIAASLQHVGLIEPLVVFPRGPHDYLLLDGHLRLDILCRTGATEVHTVFASDDESYTYNKRVNHAPPIAQHFMILKALANGVSEEQITAALNIDVEQLKKKRNLLDGICPEVVAILRDARVSTDVFPVLRKMRPVRQIEAAEHMRATGTYSGTFARALLQVTNPELLLEVEVSRRLRATSAAAQSMFAEEDASLVRDLKKIEESYGTDMLVLTVSCAYVRRLLSNDRVEQHLEKYHPDILSTLRTLVVQTSSS
jgi:RepB plasmid partitioning protein/ParB-like nuclease domain